MKKLNILGGLAGAVSIGALVFVGLTADAQLVDVSKSPSGGDYLRLTRQVPEVPATEVVEDISLRKLDVKIERLQQLIQEDDDDIAKIEARKAERESELAELQAIRDEAITKYPELDSQK